MTPTKAQDWDERYRQPGYFCGTEPVDFLREHWEELPRGEALDLAMGEGRNAVFLAAHGFRVTGIERSRPAIEKVRALAWERGVWLKVIEADLEHYALEAERFDVVMCFYYLQRALFPQIKRALRLGGALVYETYTIEQLEFCRGPRDPAYLLQPNELYRAFRDLRLAYYRERVVGGKAVASLLAWKF